MRLKNMALSAVTFALLAGSTALTTSIAVATEKDETAKLNTKVQAGERSSFVDDWDPAVSIDNAPEAKTKSAAQETTNRAPAFHSWDQAAVIENAGDNNAETENVALARKGDVAQSVDDWDPAAAINDQNHDNDEPAKTTAAVTHVIDDEQVAVDVSKDKGHTIADVETTASIDLKIAAPLVDEANNDVPAPATSGKVPEVIADASDQIEPVPEENEQFMPEAPEAVENGRAAEAIGNELRDTPESGDEVDRIGQMIAALVALPNDQQTKRNHIVKLPVPVFGRFGGDYSRGGLRTIVPVPVNFGRSINLGLYFASGRNDFDPRGIAELADLATAMRSPQLRDRKFIIGGHADAVGYPWQNKRLSIHRAVMVKRILVRKFGIAPHRLIAYGFGVSRPLIVDNPGAPENRRIEISLVEQIKVRAAYPVRPYRGFAKVAVPVENCGDRGEHLVDPRPHHSGLDDYGWIKTRPECEHVKGY